MTHVRHTHRHRLILDQAMELLRDRGYASTSMDDVARACGVSKATLYKHFHGKVDLVVGVVVDQMSRAEDVLDHLPVKATPLQRLEHMLVEGVRRRTRLGPVAAAQMPKEVTEHPAVVAQLMAMHRHLMALIGEARVAGQLRADLPVDVVAALLMNTFGPNIDLMAERLGTSPTALADELVRVVVDGLRPCDDVARDV